MHSFGHIREIRRKTVSHYVQLRYPACMPCPGLS